jgi:hypothetical protein
LVEGEVETRARILDEDQVLLVRSRDMNGFCETRILRGRQHPIERHVDPVCLTLGSGSLQNRVC